MGVAYVGLVHCDPCGCKVKGFHTVSSFERSVSKGALARDATICQEPTEVFNKAKFFDEGLVKHLVSLLKVIPVLANFNMKIEEFLDDMRSLYHGLELNQEMPLDEVANISLNTKEIHLLAE